MLASWRVTISVAKETQSEAGITGGKCPYFWQLSLPQVSRTEWRYILGGISKEGEGVGMWEGEMRGWGCGRVR